MVLPRRDTVAVDRVLAFGGFDAVLRKGQRLVELALGAEPNDFRRPFGEVFPAERTGSLCAAPLPLRVRNQSDFSANLSPLLFSRPSSRSSRPVALPESWLGRA